jgi:hypothetical protein
MNTSSPQNLDPCIDPDDAPEITGADLKRGVWAINGKIVSEAENSTLSSNDQQKLNSGP